MHRGINATYIFLCFGSCESRWLFHWISDEKTKMANLANDVSVIRDIVMIDPKWKIAKSQVVALAIYGAVSHHRHNNCWSLFILKVNKKIERTQKETKKRKTIKNKNYAFESLKVHFVIRTLCLTISNKLVKKSSLPLVKVMISETTDVL